MIHKKYISWNRTSLNIFVLLIYKKYKPEKLFKKNRNKKDKVSENILMGILLFLFNQENHRGRDSGWVHCRWTQVHWW